MTGPVLTHEDLTAAGYEPERTEHQVVVVFDVTSISKPAAARALADALGRDGLLDGIRNFARLRTGGTEVESWWFAEAEVKHIDGNDNAAMHLEHDDDVLTGGLYVQDDAEDDPTIWAHDPQQPDAPLALLTLFRLTHPGGHLRPEFARGAGQQLWELIVRGLPTAPPTACVACDTPLVVTDCCDRTACPSCDELAGASDDISVHGHGFGACPKDAR